MEIDPQLNHNRDTKTSFVPPVAEGQGQEAGLHVGELIRDEKDEAETALNKFQERVQYLVASSSLLAPRLADAMYLIVVESSLEAELRQAEQAGQKDGNKKVEIKTRESLRWPAEWETMGETWTDRSVLSSLALIVLNLLHTITIMLDRRRDSALSVPVSPPLPSAPLTLTAPVDELATIKRFISAAQEFDKKVWSTLEDFESLDAVRNEFDAHLELATPLRSRLAATLSSTTTSLCGGRQSLRDLGLEEPSEIERHELAAEKEREEERVVARKRNRLSREFGSIPARNDLSRSKRSTWQGGDFDGLDTSMRRTRSTGYKTSSILEDKDETLRRTDPLRSSTPVSHRAQLSRSQPAYQSSASTNPRPLSLNLSLHSVPSSPSHALSYSTSSFSSQLIDSAPATPEILDQRSTSALRESLDTLHATRRKVLWTILATTDDRSTWVLVERLLEELATMFETRVEELRLLILDEFGGDGLGETERRVRGRRGAQIATIEPTTALNRNRLQELTSTPVSTSSAPLFDPRSSLAPSLTFPLTHHLHFAPPDPISGPAASLIAFDSSHASISSSIRRISAKLHIVSTDSHGLALNSSSNTAREADVARLLNLHDSLKEEMESMFKQWSESRISLRETLQRPQRETVAAVIDEAGEDEDESEEWRKISSHSNLSTMTPFYSPPLFSSHSDPSTSSIDSGTIDLDHSAFLDAQFHSYLAPIGVEKVYESVDDDQTITPRPVNRFSREERIRLRAAKQVEEAGNRKESDFACQVGMMHELKEVLSSKRKEQAPPSDFKPCM